MVVVVGTSIPMDGFPAGSAPSQIVQDVPGVELEVETLIPIGDSTIPCFWVWGDELHTFEQTLASYSSVSDITQIETVEDGALYQAEWDIDSPLLRCLAKTDGTLLEAYGTAEKWSLSIMFENGSNASSFQACCQTAGIALDITSVNKEFDAFTSGTSLSSAQREAIVTAYENGYFNQPRDTTQEELAEILGITPTAVSSRLQRGIANLVEEFMREE